MISAVKNGKAIFMMQKCAKLTRHRGEPRKFPMTPMPLKFNPFLESNIQQKKLSEEFANTFT